MEESATIHFLRSAEICMGLMLFITISERVPISGLYDLSGYLWILLLGMLTILNFSALAIHLRIVELHSPIPPRFQAFSNTRLFSDDLEDVFPYGDM
jgi:hypothetical protein